MLLNSFVVIVAETVATVVLLVLCETDCYLHNYCCKILMCACVCEVVVLLRGDGLMPQTGN